MFTDQQIKEIAGELQCGMKCFIEKATNKIIIAFDWDDPYFDEGALPEEAIQELEDLRTNLMAYHEIEKMPSNKGFGVMEDFVDAMSNTRDYRLKMQLIQALNKRKPFANFKHIVENSNHREAWFAFRDEAARNWVKKQLSRITQKEGE
ncbi:MAG: UPF0158 family protein [Bacteroidota bacterium]